MRQIPMLMFVGVSSLLLACADTASAQKAAKKAANQTLVQQLEAIRTTLNMANHDYKGHRAAAVHQVSHAIHLINHGKKNPNPAETFTAGKGGNAENQAVSDKQLQSAITALQGLTVPAGKHQPQITQAITTAVSELNTALKIK
jgi:hypothetical protein